jgi:putative transposase
VSFDRGRVERQRDGTFAGLGQRFKDRAPSSTLCIDAELRAQGGGVSRGRIERLMHRHGIRAIMARPRRVRTTDSRHDFPIAPNLLERNFTAAAPNRIWLADITYVETDNGFATVLDLHSRKIVGWAMCDHLRADPPLAALRMAISAQRPGGRPHPPFRSPCSICLSGVPQDAAVSRLPGLDEPQADCYDNAPMESFFHKLKTELVHHRQYATRAEATRDIFAYVEGFYSRTRRHSAVGYISPIEMELTAARPCPPFRRKIKKKSFWSTSPHRIHISLPRPPIYSPPLTSIATYFANIPRLFSSTVVIIEQLIDLASCKDFPMRLSV